MRNRTIIALINQTDESIDEVCDVLSSVGMKQFSIGDRVKSVGQAVGVNTENPRALFKLRRRAYEIHKSYWINMLFATEDVFEECEDRFPFVFIGDAWEEDIIDGIVTPVYVVKNKEDAEKNFSEFDCIIVCKDEKLLKERLVKKITELFQ